MLLHINPRISSIDTIHFHHNNLLLHHYCFPACVRRASKLQKLGIGADCAQLESSMTSGSTPIAFFSLSSTSHLGPARRTVLSWAPSSRGLSAAKRISLPGVQRCERPLPIVASNALLSVAAAEAAGGATSRPWDLGLLDLTRAAIVIQQIRSCSARGTVTICTCVRRMAEVALVRTVLPGTRQVL